MPSHEHNPTHQAISRHNIVHNIIPPATQSHLLNPPYQALSSQASISLPSQALSSHCMSFLSTVYHLRYYPAVQIHHHHPPHPALIKPCQVITIHHNQHFISNHDAVLHNKHYPVISRHEHKPSHVHYPVISSREHNPSHVHYPALHTVHVSLSRWYAVRKSSLCVFDTVLHPFYRAFITSAS